MRKSFYLLAFILATLIGACKEDPPVIPDTSIGPNVKIVWPLNGASVLDTTYITIDATDDKKVIKVEIFIDNINNESMTMTVEPFRVKLFAEYYDPAEPHTILAKAYDEDGNVTSSEEVSINTIQFQPTNLFATLTSDTSLSLRWRDNSNVEKGFEVEQKISNGAWLPLITLDSNITSTTISGIFLKSEVYYYRIRSFNNLARSSFSEIDTATIKIPIPTDLKITSESKTSLNLGWNDNCNFETGFKIERNINGGSFAQIGEVTANQSSFIATGLDTTRTYQFRIRTITTHNVSDYSELISTGFILTGNPLRILQGHTGILKSGFFTHDNQYIVTASFDQKINFYLANDGTLMRTIQSDAPINYIDLSPDGTTIAGASEDGTIKLWNFETGSLIRTFSGHSGSVQSVKFNNDGTMLVSASVDKKVILWNTNDGTLMDSLIGHTNTVTRAIFSPDQQTIISADYSRAIKVWKISDGSLLGNMTGHTGVVFDIDVHPNGSQLVSVSNDRTVKLWNLTNYSFIKSLSGHTNSVYTVKYTPSGFAIASAGSDRRIRFWRSDNGVFMKSITYLAETINYIAFNTDGSMMISGGSSRISTLWNVGYIWSSI